MPFSIVNYIKKLIILAIAITFDESLTKWIKYLGGKKNEIDEEIQKEYKI